LQAAHAQAQTKACKRAPTFTAQRRISKIFSLAFKKLKTRNRTNRHEMTVKLNNDNGLQHWTDRRPTANNVLPQLAVTCKLGAECYYQTFVQVDSEVLRNRQLRQHANR